MTEGDLFQRFPDMTPISGPPPLMRVNGCGFGIYGSRDHDQETGSYVTTYCISFIFVPIVPLCAYRIADAESGGWYFLGKTPLSKLCRGWNWMLAVLALAVGGFGAYDSHLNSPEARARGALEAARALIASDQLVPAAERLKQVAISGTDSAATGKHELVALITRDLARAKPADAAAMIKIAHGMLKLGPLPGLDEADLWKRGAALVESVSVTDPKGAVAVAGALTPLAPDAAAHAKSRVRLLERVLAESPEDVEVASELAAAALEARDHARCIQLLAPLAKKLGNTDGARVLGLAYASAGKVDEAFALLDPYVQSRIKGLHEIAKAYREVANRIEKQAIEDLKKGKAPRSFYTDYEHADEAEQQRMFASFIRTRLNKDPVAAARQEKMREATDVVQVALELGGLSLLRAERLSDQKARRAELEAAEKVFLSIRDVAGESDEYRLHYARVCYWLGRGAEGKKLLEGIITDSERKPSVVLQVAHTLREVGDQTAARKLAEEAWEKGSDPADKEQAAWLRSVVHLGPDDELVWLERTGKSADAQATLAKARARRLAQAGDKVKAAAEFKTAIDLYASQTRSAASLNNGAIAVFGLAALTGDEAAFDRATAMLEEALSLEPGDSILIGNLADRYTEKGMREMMPGIDRAAVETQPDVEHLPLLYRDQAGLEKVGARLKASAPLQRAIAYFRKVMLTSPKNEAPYRQLSYVYWATGEAAALSDLATKARAAGIDASDDLEQSKRWLAGERDAEFLRLSQPLAERLKKVLESGKLDASPPSFALGAMHYVYLQVAVVATGAEVDVETMRKVADKAHRLQPSYATARTVRDSAALRGLKTLIQGDKAATALATSVRRHLDPASTLMVLLWKQPGLRERALKNPDVQRALEAWRERAAGLPTRQGGIDRYALRLVDPALEKQVASGSRTDPVRLADDELDAVLSSLSVPDAMHGVFDALLDRGEAAAAAAVAAARKRQVPIPEGF